jgi:amidase
MVAKTSIMKTKIVVFIISIAFGLACSTTEKEQAPTLDIPDEITIAEIHAAYEAGEYTAKELTQFYLDRIEAISTNGPALNAIIMVNPYALTIAEELDKEYAEGSLRGPLHGIPVILKDNIDTGDGMSTTAGARPMANSMPLKDSPLAAQLRSAGAIILAKANLSEWANFHSQGSSSGWSGLGGQTKNPYDLTRNPCGSSAGSGVAVSANLCVIAIGTETNGSIVCPANMNGVIGIKPTVGLISRTGIVPISFTQDSGGPMARTLTDAVITLGALTDEDNDDAKTLQEGRKAESDYTKYLKAEGLEGKRIGYMKVDYNDADPTQLAMNTALDDLRELGAEIIELDEVVSRDAGGASYQVMLYEFKDGLNKYLESLGDNRPVKDLEDLIEQTFADSIEMQYHNHALLKIAQEKGDLSSEDYLEALEKAQRLSREEGMDKTMDEHNLDAIVAITRGPAWKTDLIDKDNSGRGSSSPSAISGYPIITVPMGDVFGLPIGISIFGRAWSEPTLIEIAYNYEQATNHRITPEFKSGE